MKEGSAVIDSEEGEGGGGPEKSLRISCGGGIAVNNLIRAN